MNMRSRTSKISEEKILSACYLIDKTIKNEELRLIFLDYFKEYIYKLNLRMKKVAINNSIPFIILAINIGDLSIKNFDWNLLCNLYNLNYKKEIISNQNYFDNTELAIDVAMIVDDYKNNIKATGWVQYFNSVSGLYEYLAKLKRYHSYENIHEILNYKELLGIFNTITINDIKEEEDNQIMRRKIVSNYPDNSDYRNLIKIEYTNGPNKDKKQFTNININTNNKVIKSLINNFFKYYSNRGQPTDFVFKSFMYYWNESIGENKIESYYDFTEELFLNQYKYYLELEKDFKSTGEIKVYRYSYVEILVTIYRHLIDEKSKKDTNIYNDIFSIVINIKYYKKVFEEGYKPIFFSTSECPINYDKICILPSSYTMNNSNMNNTNIRYLDFSELPSKYRMDVKTYIWEYNGQVNEVIRKVHYIFEFLLQRETYVNKNNYIYKMGNYYKEFTEEFLYEYKFKMENKYESGGTLKSIYMEIRRFLKHVSEKYNVDSYDIDIFNLIGLQTFSGGKPITENDINLIYGYLMENQKDNKFNRLYTIVFEIFISTNLRIGEILNLRRNCILHKNQSNGSGTINLLLKTGCEEYIEKEVEDKIINLLEEANVITCDINSNSFVSDYIFVEPKLRTINPYWARISFSSVFRKMINELNEKLDNKDYVPYNIRHTFINNAYKIGTKLNYSIPEIAAITGNSYTTAVRHYRDYDEIDNYVESLSKVIISNVDINGKILKKYNCEENKYVRGDLGICIKENCSFEIAECLICNNFVTFTSRIPIFEKFIKYLSDEIENNENIYYTEEQNTIKKVAARYLAELYKLN